MNSDRSTPRRGLLALWCLGASLAVALPLRATTYYVATTGSDTTGTGSSGSPWKTIQKCVDTMAAGDTCIVKPGTYTGSTTITTGGTSGAVKTIKAETPAVKCTDPSGNPDACEIDTAARTIITAGTGFSLSGASADYCVIEGFQMENSRLAITGTSIGTGPDHITVRYMHFKVSSETNTELLQTMYASDVTIEHSYFFNPYLDNGCCGTTNGPDYAVQFTTGTRNITANNLYFGGSFNHNISVKRDADNISLSRIVCEGNVSECIFLGQQQDDTTSISGGTSCSSSPNDEDATLVTLRDHTSSNITIRKVFGRRASRGGTNLNFRYGLRIGNASDVDARDLFFANNSSNLSDGTGFIHNLGGSSAKEGRCGVEPGNNLVRGLIVVNPQTHGLTISGNGHDTSALTIDNYTVVGPGSGTHYGVRFTSLTPNTNNPWETTAHPVTTLRNGNYVDFTSQFSGQNDTRVTDDYNNAYNVGTVRGQTHDLSVDPNFAGSTTVPIPALDDSYFNDGVKLWDWAGTYQPIIDQFVTSPAGSAFNEAGTGTAVPCEATCDIGTNEFFGGAHALPEAPSGLSATKLDYDSITLGWTDNSANETGFKIERKCNSGGTYTQIDTVGANAVSYTDNTCAPNRRYYYRVRAYNATGDSGYATESFATTDELTSGRQGHWKLNETTGTTTVDASGNGNTGTLSNGPVWTNPGLIDGALSFDGADDVVNCGSGTTLDNLPAAGMTLSAMFKADTIGEGTFGRIMAKCSGTTPTAGWQFSLGASNVIAFAADFTTANLTRYSATSAYNLGEWVHVLLTWDGSTSANNVRIYINGAEVSSYSVTNNASGTRVDDATSNLYLGNESGGTRTFDGLLDEIRVYNRVLSAAEITALYRQKEFSEQD